ncbi:PE family protein [Mycobacterium spongiae]|uniref:PE family protein n=1 Tax=Mycobacterium spongiae TaxID=886343 RepID=UPI001BA83C84|nr:PE family protein [Mycobacterium spongiae]
MSFVVAAPETVASAAGNLAGIGATLEQATAAAAAPTTGVAAAAADEVSIAISRLFATHGQEFQAISTRVATFHSDFVRLLNGGASAYIETEIANAGKNLVNAVNAPARAPLELALRSGVSAVTNGEAAALVSDQIGAGAKAVSRIVADVPRLQALETALSPGLLGPAAAAGVPGGAYGQLFSNTATNLQALYNAWSANPFPFLSQIIANQQVYWQEIAAALANAIQNFPALLANLPAAIEAAIQQLLAFNAAFYIQQIVSTQIGFAELFATTVQSAVGDLVAGWPNFETGLQLAFQQALAGNYQNAVADFGQALSDLLITGFDTSDVTVDVVGTTVNVTANPKLLGPLGDLFTIMNIPGQQAQFFTDLIPPSILRDMAQNLTNVLNTLTLPTISATLSIPLLDPASGTLSAFFGVPLVLTYAFFGGPFNALNAIAASAETIQEALSAGNFAGAAGALIDAPAYALDGYLNTAATLDTNIPVPTGLNPPFPTQVLIILHLPFDGILVPPHPVTATIDTGIIAPFDVTVFGTPFAGMVPLLVNYIPQQLANAITP